VVEELKRRPRRSRLGVGIVRKGRDAQVRRRDVAEASAFWEPSAASAKSSGATVGRLRAHVRRQDREIATLKREVAKLSRG
jgi:hypothetical protein